MCPARWRALFWEKRKLSGERGFSAQDFLVFTDSDTQNYLEMRLGLSYPTAVLQRCSLGYTGILLSWRFRLQSLPHKTLSHDGCPHASSKAIASM